VLLVGEAKIGEWRRRIGKGVRKAVEKLRNIPQIRDMLGV